MSGFSVYVQDPAGGHNLAVADVSKFTDDNGIFYYVSRVLVPYAMRGKGIGTQLMTKLANEADERRIQLYIDPTTNYGSDLKRLTAFFERFGFVTINCKSRGKMVRLPYSL